MNILNFRLTYESIKTRLTALVGRSQVEIGTTWSAVRAPKGYHTLGGSRPVLMIFISKDLNTNLVKKQFAQTLGKLTGGMFIAADSGSNVFNQASASVDVEILFYAWLKVLNELQAQLQKQTNSADDDSNNEILKMQLLRIVFHGWKSDPKCINDPFENDHENDIFASCKAENPDFDVTFDLGQKYQSEDVEECIKTSRTNDDIGISMIKVPVFGISGKFPGFKVDTWSMFGPICGTQPMGSIKLDRIDSDDSFLPVNVTRVKVYPSIVNLTKALGFGTLNLTKANFTGSFKQLKRLGNKISDFLMTITGSDWRNCANMLMSFRIECTIQLNNSICSLNDACTQFKNFQSRLESTLSANTSLGLVALV